MFENELNQLQAVILILDGANKAKENSLKQEVAKFDLLTESKRNLNSQIQELSTQLDIKKYEIKRLKISYKNFVETASEDKKIHCKKIRSLNDLLEQKITTSNPRDGSYTSKLLDFALAGKTKMKLNHDKVEINLRNEVEKLREKLQEPCQISHKPAVTKTDSESQTCNTKNDSDVLKVVDESNKKLKVLYRMKRVLEQKMEILEDERQVKNHSQKKSKSERNK